MAASKVTDLRKRRIERLADELEPFLRRGHAVVDLDGVPSARTNHATFDRQTWATPAARPTIVQYAARYAI